MATRRRWRRSRGKDDVGGSVSPSISFMAMLLESFIERSVRQEVHRRNWRLVPRDETLAEVSKKVLVGRLRTLPCDVAETVPQPLLHLETGIGSEDARHRPLRDLLGEEAGVVDAGADGADPHLRLCVGTDGERRVERHAIPEELSPAFIDASAPCEPACCVCPLDLEAPSLTLVLRGEPDVVEQGGHRDDLLVVVQAPQLGDLHREEPGPDRVVEEVWRGHGARLIHRPRHEGCVWNDHPGNFPLWKGHNASPESIGRARRSAPLDAFVPGRTHAARCRDRCHDTDVCVSGGRYTSRDAGERRYAVSGRAGETAACTDRAVSLPPDRVREAARRTSPISPP